MTAVLDAPADLTGLTDDQLAALCAGADDATIAAVTAEGDRRDRADAARQRATERNQALYAEWREWAHADYLAAEERCAGNLLSREGEKHTEEPMRLWSLPEHTARLWASEELGNYWDESHGGHMTFARYKQQRATSRRLDREEHAMESSSSERNEAGPATGTTLPHTCHSTRNMPAMQAKHAAAGSGNEGDMDTRMDAARQRATERIDAARERLTAKAGARNDAIDDTVAQIQRPHTQVATREADVVAPTTVYAPARRQRPDAAELLRQVLEQIGMYLCEYIQFPSRAAVVAVVLWIAHGAARGADKKLIWRATPRLLLTSAQNGSGKSTLMDLIAVLLLSRVGRMVKVTAAGLAGVLNELGDVGLPDDAQLIFGTTGAAAKDLQGVLLGSYSKKGSWVTGKSTVSVKPVYGPVAYAGKDQLITVQREKLTDLLARSVIIRMERPSQYMPQPDDAADDKGEMIGKGLAAVMGALEGELLQAVRELDREARGQQITEGDGGRTAQIFRQLRAVARVAGGNWPAAMDEAAEELIADAGDLITVEDMLKSLARDMDPGDIAAEGAAPTSSFWDQMEGMSR